MNQEKALSILKSGKNIFLTGSAGAGKTYVLNQYIQYLKERRIPVSITASTGIAATHLEGTTIHAWSGIGIKDSLSLGNLRDLRAKKYLKKNIDKSKVLIIDEISMLHKKQLDLVNEVLQFFR
ncbi:MAG: AAA family ATPase, partial [Flavobacteriaceae bacterium]|nr:AAA family ATPase [Flavobacteriaceae bacterium]